MTQVLHWCIGPCGRELPVEAFPRNNRGEHWWRCAMCRRFMKRERYRRDKRFRRRTLRHHHRWYVKNAKDQIAKEHARYVVKCEEIKARNRQWYADNRVEILRRQRLRRGRPKTVVRKVAA